MSIYWINMQRRERWLAHVDRTNKQWIFNAAVFLVSSVDGKYPFSLGSTRLVSPETGKFREFHFIYKAFQRDSRATRTCSGENGMSFRMKLSNESWDDEMNRVICRIFLSMDSG